MIQKIKQEKITLMFLVFVLGLSIFSFVRTINVNDFYWHVKTGEFMVTKGYVPTNGIFSWYADDLHWTAHEWLFAVLIYGIEYIAGNFGVFMYSVLTGTTLMMLIFFNIRKELHRNPLILLVWFSLAAMSIFMILSARPHMLMFILTTLLMMLLYHFKRNPETKLIWLLPVISLLWANIHGGSSNLAYALPIILFITSIRNFKFLSIEMKSLPANKLKLFGILILVSVLMVMVNPNGYRMLLYPYTNMGDTLMLSFINEWRAPDAKETTDMLIAFAPLVIHLVTLTIKNKKIQVEDVLYTLFFAYMTMRSIRFAYYIYMIQSLVMFKDMEFTILKEHKKKVGILAMMLGVTFAVSTGLTFHPDNLAVKEMDDEIIEKVMEVSPKRVLNDYNYGGYLIYHDIPVFIDGRADIYSAYNVKNYLSFTEFKMPDIEKYLQEYQFDSILIRKSNAVYNYLKEQDYLELVIENKDSVFYRIDYEKIK